MNKIYLDWEEFGIMVDKLAELIKKSKFKFDCVYGIPRGGIILAVCLAHKLNLPILTRPLRPTEDSLVADDISDTGLTLEGYKYKKSACLYTTNWTKVQPDFALKLKQSKEDWIVFPWEEK